MDQANQMRAPLRVLHLEDNSADAELIRMSLEDHNIPCSIIQVSTLKEFEAAFQKGDVDLILSDSNLPSFETMKALKWVRETQPAIPFIFVSGTRSPKIREEALAGGARDFISKEDLPKLMRVMNQFASE